MWNQIKYKFAFPINSLKNSSCFLYAFRHLTRQKFKCSMCWLYEKIFDKVELEMNNESLMFSTLICQCLEKNGKSIEEKEKTHIKFELGFLGRFLVRWLQVSSKLPNGCIYSHLMLKKIVFLQNDFYLTHVLRYFFPVKNIRTKKRLILVWHLELQYVCIHNAIHKYTWHDQ